MDSTNTTFDFLKPDNMKLLGFDCTKSEHPYYSYENDGTKHRNKDYNSKFPEPKGKVTVDVNLDYSVHPFVLIKNDGGTRTSYHGVATDEQQFETILNSIR